MHGLIYKYEFSLIHDLFIQIGMDFCGVLGLT